ncbi:hypothetical protein [Methanosarcina siciliae]|nr:hypothetical protein [Methanosarcina siciliae]
MFEHRRRVRYGDFWNDDERIVNHDVEFTCEKEGHVRRFHRIDDI